jgi:hypothetical protein
MKKFISGAGVDTTAEVVAYLKANKRIWLADLYLIGEPDDPAAFWLTNYESPLVWSQWGKFQSTVIKRGSIRSAVGLEAESLDLTWSPRNKTITTSIATASPYQLARLGFFDNMRVRMWRTYMPTPGDADTFGAAEWFAGWIGDIPSTVGSIDFQVNSYLYALNQKVPTCVIESTSPLASYSGGIPPPHFSVMPQFRVIVGAGTTESVIYADQISPNPLSVPHTNDFNDGYIVFNGGAGATLKGQFSIIGRNLGWVDGGGHNHTEIQLYSPLPWAPTPGVDTFYVSVGAPINLGDTGYDGFPYVPAPETAA